MAPDGSTSSASAVPKSKQERIRDNQRRSRARRQEYLADLERRLKECHITCREAELQRAALADLQVENARLRDLLNYAGVSPDVVEGFGRRSVASHTSHAPAAVHRQIKPKYQPQVPLEHPNAMMTTKQPSNPGSRCPTTLTSSQLGAPACLIPLNSPTIYGSQDLAPFMPTPTTDSADVSPTSSYDWVLGSHSKSSMEVSFCCDTFQVPPNGPLIADNGNTVQCSVATMMIDQYHPTPTEMEEIKARLATGFSFPRPSEPGCRVNTQMLFHILQEMNSRELQD